MRLAYFLRLLLLAFILAACAPGTDSSANPPAATAYIENKGSDTIVNLALGWAEKYQTLHPGSGSRQLAAAAALGLLH
jgi:phosphate transport system substrate-binding protein